MTGSQYEFRWLTYGQIWNALPKSKLDPYKLKNQWSGSEFVIEADASGFRQLAVHFLLVAANGDHAHLQSKDGPRGVSKGWMFDTGVEVTIGNDEFGGPNKGPPKLEAFRYQATPIFSDEAPKFNPGAECSTQYEQEEGFLVSSNTAGLLGLAENCLDLAHDETPVGISLTFVPGRQLSTESVRLILRKA